MPLPYTKTKIGAALIAALLASGGGIAFLHKNPEPTLRDVFKACEAGEVTGIACCEDMNRVKDERLWELQCGMVAPGYSDPFGVRAQEEDDWDKNLAKEKAAFVK